MPVNDRRASYMNAPRPRVVSNRVADAEKATPRSGASSFQSDNMDQMRGSTSSHRSKLSRDQNASEKRSERTVVTAREKAQTRTRSVKEPAGAGRGERERTRPKRHSHADAASPNVRKEKEHIEGMSYFNLRHGIDSRS